MKKFIVALCFLTSIPSFAKCVIWTTEITNSRSGLLKNSVKGLSAFGYQLSENDLAYADVKLSPIIIGPSPRAIHSNNPYDPQPAVWASWFQLEIQKGDQFVYIDEPSTEQIVAELKKLGCNP